MPDKTTSIPAWSAQITYNGPKDERDLLVRMAADSGARSMAQFLKELVAIGVAAKSRASAQELRDIRKRYYGAPLLCPMNCEAAARACPFCPLRDGCHFEECVTVETEET